ncbi:ATP-binding protein [Alicyclobacillus shizuokensis]|uniref:ATP-binding protein n=1 Tax=Alicyclobacillus shizuokensis TaxID=392014 RepID=UPI0008338572|nr:AAA family ATPase [Alicyclobacillus shizuokensis]
MHEPVLKIIDWQVGITAYGWFYVIGPILGFIVLFSWYFDIGRVAQNLWRFLVPFWLLVLIAMNLLAPTFLANGVHTKIWLWHLNTQETFETYVSALAVWAVLNYFSIGPTQLFAFITRLQMHTLTAWRARNNPYVGNWIDKEFERARERRLFLAEAFHLPHGVRQWLGHGISSRKTRPYSPEAAREATRRFEENMRRFQSPPPSSSQNESSGFNDEEEGFHNGRVRWKEKGKQYRANPDALRKIIGMQNVIQEIQESIVLPLKSADLMQKYDVPIKTGILLYGPPGNGKTALARAVAESLGLYFIAVRASDLMGTLVGATEQNITSLFAEARRHAPSIIFIDEIDGIGGKRGGMNPYHDSQLNQLLAEMDGFEPRDRVFVIAATNRLEDLDEALIRPGRLGTKIYVPNPSEEDIRIMFWRWTEKQGVKLSPEVKSALPVIPKLFEGASGAEVSQVAENLRRRTVLAKHSGQKFIVKLEDVVREVEKVRNQPVPLEVRDLFLQ